MGGMVGDAGAARSGRDAAPRAASRPQPRTSPAEVSAARWGPPPTPDGSAGEGEGEEGRQSEKRSCVGFGNGFSRHGMGLRAY